MRERERERGRERGQNGREREIDRGGAKKQRKQIYEAREKERVSGRKGFIGPGSARERHKEE